MVTILSGDMSRDIWVKPNSGADLLQTWNAYFDERRIRLPLGSYVLSDNLNIPDSADVRNISLIGSGSFGGTKITGSAGLTDKWHIQSSVAAGNKGKTLVEIDGIEFDGSDATQEKGGIRLDNCKMKIGIVYINGAFKDAASDYLGLFCAGTSGDSNRSQSIETLTIYPTTDVQTLFYTKADGLSVGSLSLNHSAASGTNGLVCENKISIAHFGYYIGDGRTLDSLIRGTVNEGHIKIGVLSADRSTTGLITNLFKVGSAISTVVVDNCWDKGGAVRTNLFADATTQSRVRIVGFYNAEQVADAKEDSVANKAATTPTVTAWEGRTITEKCADGNAVFVYVNGGWHYVALT